MSERKRITGVHKNGLPNWFLHYLKYYDHLESARGRVLTRLFRMHAVLRGRRESLGWAKRALLQNPGQNPDLDFPD